jgi:hypothetical protein
MALREELVLSCHFDVGAAAAFKVITEVFAE